MNIESIETPLGPFSVEVRDGVVTRAEFGTFAKAGPPTEISKRLSAYFEGDLLALDAIEVSATGSPFAMRVWKALRGVPAGETMSYGEVAQELGDPNAARAVGTACGKNPIGLIVPCHRVIRGDGSLGGYASGLDIKEWLLAHERN